MTIEHDFPLSEVLWYKIGGNAKTFIQAFSYDDLKQAVHYINSNDYRRFFICGSGSNLIFTDDPFDGVVLKIGQSNEGEIQVLPHGQIRAYAGVTLDKVIQTALDNGLVGLEWAGGLPGTIGAGVRGNVGAFGGEIQNSVVEVEVMALKKDNSKTEIVTKDALHFSYRHSELKEKKDLVVLSVLVQLSDGTEEEIENARAVYIKNSSYRREKHPLEYPNCGSVFKNVKRKEDIAKVLAVWPETKEMIEGKWHGKVSMGYIIKKLGFSGKTVGNAQVSEKHANFIINKGGAKAKDVVSLIHEIQNSVQETFGFIPEVEVEIVA